MTTLAPSAVPVARSDGSDQSGRSERSTDLAPDIRDSGAPLRWYIVLLIGLPSGLVFEPLGAAGAPASILGLGLCAWWLNARLVPRLRVHRGPQPVRIALYLFLFAAAISYLAGTLRPMTSEEASSSTRFLLTIAAWAGVVLVTADGMRDRASIDRLLRFLVWAGVFLAVLGLIQFFSGWNPAGLIQIPGLHNKSTEVGNIARANFTRVQGTAAHAIEFGVVLSMILPLAFHYAWFATERKRLHWAAVLLIGMALPLTVSRSAILALLIVMVVLFASWPHERRWKVLRVLPFLAVLLKVMVPGLLGALKGLFANFSNDPSTQGRTDDFAAAAYYIERSPFFGRGLSTFIPELYRTLDNAYIGWLIEAGLVGTILLGAFLLTVIGVAFHVRTRARGDEKTRDLGSALGAGLLATVFNFGTFDALGFAMASGTFFLLVGVTGAVWRLAPPQDRQDTRSIPRVRWTDRLRRPNKAIALVVQLAGAAIGIAFVLIPGVVRTEYSVSASVQMFGPTSAKEINPYTNSPYLDLPSEIAQRIVMSPDTAASLRARGLSDRYTVASGLGSLMPMTDKTGRGAVIMVNVRADSSDVALRSLDAVITQLQERWSAAQLSVGSPAKERLPVLVATRSDIPTELHGNKHKAMAAAGAIGFAAGGSVWYLIGTLRRRRMLRDV